MRLALFSLLVRDYDEAIEWFTRVLGLRLIEDSAQGEKRWVIVGADVGSSLLLARAKNAREAARVGDQHGGRVGFFLHTDNLEEAYDRLRASGVTFDEEPRDETYGRVVVFRDLYGNRWDLIQS
jgi:catechol 2,3-dioxygenase-like lactoylglutathione lyase family enzyme